LIAASPDNCPSPQPSPRKNGEREETAAALAAHGSGARLELRALSKAFGTAKAIDQVSLQIPAGAFVSLLGPSGSGKTTMLNLIAGFLSADSGEILLDGASIAAVPPHRRNIGMVFQSYSLFPHMRVAENVRFPLRMRSALSRSAARERVNEMLTLVQLAHLGERYPRQLSGGQQQRVAMARALVSRPRLLLMDEPLGALDKKLLEQMQVEIRRIHRSVGTTVLYVTHDQAEALSMSDVVAVMHQGRIAQIGPPRLLYEAPADVFVADFLGDSNLLAGRCLRTAGDAATVELPGGEVVHAVQGTVAAKPGDAVVVHSSGRHRHRVGEPGSREPQHRDRHPARHRLPRRYVQAGSARRQHRDDGQSRAGARARPHLRPAALLVLENHRREASSCRGA
jgi:putative spermidine/putrescine transport system ATP-binding protein